MSLRYSYTLWAPIYDLFVDRAFHDKRCESLLALRGAGHESILIPGIGSGLDIPHLPAGPSYTGIDLTPAMLKRARSRAEQHRVEIKLEQGNAMQLPYADASFDRVVMHLILAVVPKPELALQEACRVLRPGGQIHIFDKFLRPSQLAPLRRAISPLLGLVATRTNVVFEQLLSRCPELEVVRNREASSNGWFRFIDLRKRIPSQPGRETV